MGSDVMPYRKKKSGRKPASPFSHWKARQLRGNAKAVEAALQLPPHEYVADTNPDLPRYDGYGLKVPIARTRLNERLTNLMRFIGRMYVTDAHTTFRMLYYRNHDLSCTYRDLKKLASQKLVWSINEPTGTDAARPRKVFGLTHAGKQALIDMRIEDSAALELIISRDPRKSIPNPNTIDHDLQVSWWCASMIEGLRLIPWCTNIYVQSEFRSAKNQRIDAVLTARFDFSRPRDDISQIPWFDGRPLTEGEVELRWALELDNSSESVPILIEKFVNYRNLHASGQYHRLFKGDLLLVLIVQNSRRAATLAAEFERAWPEGWGVVSTPDRKGANSTPYGALWGTYADMNTGAIIPLLSAIHRPRGEEAAYQPLMTYPMWESLLQARTGGAQITSLSDLTRWMRNKPISSPK